MVVSRFPRESETFVVNKFVGLNTAGLQAYVACRLASKEAASAFPQLEKVPHWQRRARRARPVAPAWLAVLLLPLTMLWCLWHAPGHTVRYLRRGWRDAGLSMFRRLYVDAPVIVARPDIVHFEFGALARGRMHLRDYLGCRVVVSFRGYDLNFSGVEEPGYYDSVWASADGIHCLGEHLWQRAIERGCPPDTPHAIIHPAINLELFVPPERVPREVGLDDRPLRIVSVGRLEWKKGYEFGLQAVQRAIDAGLQVDYRIVGSGSHMEPLAYCRHQLGLADHVHFLGGASPEQVREQLEWADVFLHSAVTEGFCNAVLEAQAMALPVIVTDAGGLPENVEDGVTGFVVPRRDPGAMANRLLELARRPRLRTDMGRAGRSRVQRHFTETAQLDQFVAFYRQVVDGGDDLRVHRTSDVAAIAS